MTFALEWIGRTAMRHRWMVAAALTLSTAAAFRPANNVVLVVRNDNASAARVFAGASGNWRYLGPVRSRSVERYELAWLDQSGSPLRLFATLGRDTVRAGPLTVLSGQSILLTLHEELSRSGAVVR